jgi:type I restriction enzyme, S subunit
MELKPGYKLTEVGIIPEDWRVINLGECLTNKPDYGINAPAVRYLDTLPKYIRITDISDDGYFCPDSPVSVDHPSSNQYFLETGDLVFARTGASVGKSYLYDPYDGNLVFAGFLIRIKPDSEKLLPQYLAYYVQTSPYWNWVALMSMRSGQPGINGNEYSTLPILLPPLHEQRAIADALSEIDAQIATLDDLIAKKRDLKQGAMQELLTGERRLPGYSGEWESISIGEILTYEQPSRYIVQDTEYRENGIPVLTPGKTFVLGYTDELDGIYDNLPVIIFDDFTTASKYVEFPFKVKSSAIKLLTVKDRVASLRFVFEKMQMIQFPLGDHKRYYISEYQFIEIHAPPLEEQTAIAAVLSEMDAEIEALEAELVKTHALKQGMMHELLTGNTRLLR